MCVLNHTNRGPETPHKIIIIFSSQVQFAEQETVLVECPRFTGNGLAIHHIVIMSQMK